MTTFVWNVLDGISHYNDNTSVCIVQSADREIRLLFPEYFNEGLSVQRSMEDMEDDHRLVEDAILFIYFIYLGTQSKIYKSKIGRRTGTFETNTRRMFYIFLVSAAYFLYIGVTRHIQYSRCFENLRALPMQGKCIHCNSIVLLLLFYFIKC
jgi:hypothetical protein